MHTSVGDVAHLGLAFVIATFTLPWALLTRGVPPEEHEYLWV